MKHWKFRAAAIIVIIAALFTGTLDLVNSEDVNGAGGGISGAVSRILSTFTGGGPAPGEPGSTTAPGGDGLDIRYDPPGAATAPPIGITPVGGVDIAIRGDEGNDPAQKATNVAPNQRIPKDFHVDNQGSADIYVFMAVTVPYVNIASQKDDGTYLPAMAQPLYSFTAKPGWTLVEDEVSGDRATYVYAYASGSGEGGLTVLKPGQSTGKLFDELVTLNYVEGKLDGTQREVVAQAYAIQAQDLGEANNTARAVWTLVKNGRASKQ